MTDSNMSMTEIKANALLKIELAYPRYLSHAETYWAQYGNLILGSEYGSEVVWRYYQGITVRVPGGSYKPDFLYVMADGGIIAVEVKGSRRQQNYRDARSKLRAAAELYWWMTWYEVRIAGEDYELELIRPAGLQSS